MFKVTLAGMFSATVTDSECGFWQAAALPSFQYCKLALSLLVVRSKELYLLSPLVHRDLRLIHGFIHNYVVFFSYF